ncbi:MAG: DUF3800 domain-containing protein [Micrococcales bacterium]|nr:DUF3800 domain-containing protein [Micrococcales bacterium]
MSTKPISVHPVFVVAGLSVDDDLIDDLLMDYVRLKTRFEPSLRHRQLSDVIQREIKGATLRRDIRNTTSRDTRRRAVGYLDNVLQLLERYGCQIMGRVLVKQAGEVYSPASTYPSAVAELATTFDHHAAEVGQRGWIVLDSQTKVKNEGNVHTITTRRYRHGGGLYPQLVESPVFGHSDTHVLLQIADLLASALIYPAACAAYLLTTPGDPHLDPAFATVRQTFGARLANLEHRYTDPDGNHRGGFRVIDRAGGQPGRLLLNP